MAVRTAVHAPWNAALDDFVFKRHDQSFDVKRLPFLSPPGVENYSVFFFLLKKALHARSLRGTSLSPMVIVSLGTCAPFRRQGLLLLGPRPFGPLASDGLILRVPGCR